jgi:hypothetical protein
MFTGTIVALDVPNRTVVVAAEAGGLVEMIVDQQCQICLNGEPVRLRLLLAGDQVEALVVNRHGQSIAYHIAVKSRQHPRKRTPAK